jgi:hypothetical protein
MKIFQFLSFENGLIFALAFKTSPFLPILARVLRDRGLVFEKTKLSSDQFSALLARFDQFDGLSYRNSLKISGLPDSFSYRSPCFVHLETLFCLVPSFSPSRMPFSFMEGDGCSSQPI